MQIYTCIIAHMWKFFCHVGSGTQIRSSWFSGNCSDQRSLSTPKKVTLKIKETCQAITEGNYSPSALPPQTELYLAPLKYGRQPGTVDICEDCII